MYGNMFVLRKVFALNNLKSGDRFSGEPQRRDKVYSRRPHLGFDRIAQLCCIILMRVSMLHICNQLFTLVAFHKRRLQSKSLTLQTAISRFSDAYRYLSRTVNNGNGFSEK